ncbi:unnamed protein product [Adineta steineri]|uniref:VASt domain-containing protein n=1 Tax=Adineta steineri TaxID=433720 RepID=A0A818LLE8_9BILA|nr:unnamed protein product [Adineta steineri]
MSRHGVNKEKQEMEQKPARSRSNSHTGHINLIPTSVINHIKRRVKKQRSEKDDSLYHSDGLSVQSINGIININNNNNNNNNKQSNENHDEHTDEVSSNSGRSRTFTAPAKLLNRISSDKKTPSTNIQTKVVSEDDELNLINSTEINVQDQTNYISADTDQKSMKTKCKKIKATISLPETSGKKRRQTVRRTGFQLRDEDFSKIFSDLPSDEQLIIAFPCAWRKDVFIHGRMFLSVNYFSFYTCFFRWEESLCIPYTDIISITREKSAKLVPNAIRIRTKNQEQYSFVSLTPREKVFIAIFRLWQNALLDQPIDYQKLRSLVYADQQNHDESTGDSEESINLETAVDIPTESAPDTKLNEVSSKPPRPSTKRPKLVHQATVSLSLDNEPINYLPTCSCETHLAKTYAERTFTLSVDKLFELICDDNEFTRDFHVSQKLTEFTYGEWNSNNETNKRERQVTYKTVSQSILGTNTLTCREKQTLEVDKPHLMYVLSTEVYNEGMKYTDAFYVATKFCMVQCDSEHSSLRVTAEIRYIKSVYGFIKTFIEKNSHTYIENGVNEQVRRLEKQQKTQIKPKSTIKSLSIIKQDSQESIIPEIIPENHIKQDTISLHESNTQIIEKTITGKGITYDIVMIIGIFLLILHIYLCYKLYSIDNALSVSDTVCFNQCKKVCFESK